MNKQQMVKEFHKAFGAPAPNRYNSLLGFRGALRINLINEEAEEFREAVEDNNPIKMIDALCDILYVTYGAAVEMGINLDEYFAEVHRSNMAKLGSDGKPVVREDGKVIKPAGWTPPDIEGIFSNE